MNDRNGQNQFRPKPKFRPSWPKVRPKFRPKLYQNYVKLGPNFRDFFTSQLGIIIWEMILKCKWAIWAHVLIGQINEFRALEKNSQNLQKIDQKIGKKWQKFAKMAVFCYFGVSAEWPKDSAEIFRPGWPKFRPKFRFRSYTTYQTDWSKIPFTI